MAELDETIKKENMPPRLRFGDGDDDEQDNDEEDADEKEEEEPENVDAASFLEMLDDITVAPPEIAWRL